MNRTDISQAVGDIADRYLLEAMDGMADAVAGDSGEVVKMKTKKRPSLRKTVSLALASCLVFCLGVTAYAADSSFSNWFRGVFSGPPAAESVYEQLSAGEMPACTSNGTTVTPVAAIADNSMCYIRLKIEAPEGTVLELPTEGEGFWQLARDTDNFELLVNKKTGKSEPGESWLSWEDAVPGDNTVEAVLVYAGQTGGTHFNDGEARTVNIHNIWLQDVDKNYSVVLAGSWSFDIVFPVGEARTLDVEGLAVRQMIDGEIADSEGVEMTLTRMSISPLSLDVTYRFTTPDADAVPGPGTILVVMKDGREITSQQGNGEDGRDWTRSTRIFDTPIDVNEVDYVQFGSQQIKVN